MIKNIEDLQKLGQVNVDSYMKGFGEWNKSWQTLAAEMTDYSKRTFEDGTAAFEKLLTAKSVEQAVEIEEVVGVVAAVDGEEPSSRPSTAGSGQRSSRRPTSFRPPGSRAPRRCRSSR